MRPEARGSGGNEPKDQGSDTHEQRQRDWATDLREVARCGDERVPSMIDEPSQPRRVGARQSVVAGDIFAHGAQNHQRPDEGDDTCRNGDQSRDRQTHAFAKTVPGPEGPAKLRTLEYRERVGEEAPPTFCRNGGFARKCHIFGPVRAEAMLNRLAESPGRSR